MRLIPEFQMYAATRKTASNSISSGFYCFLIVK